MTFEPALKQLLNIILLLWSINYDPVPMCNINLCTGDVIMATRGYRIGRTTRPYRASRTARMLEERTLRHLFQHVMPNSTPK